MFGIPEQYEDQFDNPGDRLAGRITAATYNLAVQRERRQRGMSSSGILAQMMNQWLSNRFSR